MKRQQAIDAEEQLRDLIIEFGGYIGINFVEMRREILAERKT